MRRDTTSEFEGTDRFSIRRRLGAGGMGVVYEAFDRERGVAVALKTLRRMEPRALYRLKKEFRAHQNLHHRNLVRIGELVEEAGQWFFTMELVRGVDFLSYVWSVSDRRRGDTEASVGRAETEPLRVRMPGEAESAPNEIEIPRLRLALSQLASGLVALHGAGKVHRDLKPSNLLVTDDDRLVILDFGLIAETASDLESSSAEMVGTATYMAPEQAAALPVGPAADWYSVGVLLYEALAGVPPFRGQALQVMLDKQQRTPEPLPRVAPDAPADLVKLCAELLRFEPTERPVEAEIVRRLAAEAPATLVSGTSESTQSPPFVGRTAELAVLAEAFDRVEEGSAVTVYVVGASGVGKSALIREFADTAREEHSAVVLAGRCYERESVPYKAFDGVVDALSRYMRRLPPGDTVPLLPADAALLPRIFPVLGLVDAIARSPLPRGEHSDPYELRRRGFAALRDLLARLADRSPLVVIIDDLQWADEDSFQLIRELVAPPSAPPLLLLVSAREEPHAPGQTASEAILRDPIPGDVRHIGLGTLAREDALELARRLLERGGIPVPENAETIAEEAAGHPLYIDELVRHVASAALAPHRRARLDDAIWARVRQLPPGARAALEALCVATAPLPRQVIRRATRLERAEFSQQVSLLRVSSLVRSRGVRETDVLEPYHDRVREAVRERLAEDVVQMLHERLAQALRSTGLAERRPELVVPHLRAVGRIEEAAMFAESGARRAAETLAFDRAVALYRTAVDLRSGVDTVPPALRAQLANALVLAGRRAEAASEYTQAAHGAPAADALEYQRLAAESYLKSGHVDDGVTALRAVLESVGLPYQKSGRQALISALTRRAWLRVRGLGFKERDASQVSDEVLRRVDVCWTAAGGFGMVDTIRSVDYSTRHLLHALHAGERQRVARALAVEACLVSTTGIRGAKRSFYVLKRLSRLAGDDPYLLGWVKGAEALARYQLGEFRRASELCVECAQLFQQGASVIPWEQSAMSMWHLWSLFHLGEVRRFSEWVPQLLRDAEMRGDLYVAATLCTGLPNAHHLFRDDVDGARAENEGQMARWSRASYHLQHYWQFVARNHIYLYGGDGKTAWSTLGEGWEALTQSLYLRIPMVSAEAHDLRARCALAAAPGHQDRERLLRSAEKDARTAERGGHRAGGALAALIRAGVAYVRGDTEKARVLLARAAVRLDAADMALVAASARRRLGRLVGGDEGAGLVRDAERWMRSQGIVNVARTTALFAPGFDSD